MVASFLITAREGLEAALIVVIILAYLKAIGQDKLMLSVWVGTVAALFLSLLVGTVIFVTAGEFEGRAEQLFEGVVMLAAVAVLSWMIVWMKRQSTRLRGDLESRVETALLTGSGLALAAIPFVAVLREGVETALFMFAATRTSTPTESTLGAILGVTAAAALGFALYRGARRLDIRLFFNVTGFLLIFFAAGLLAHGIHELQEAEVLPVVVEHVWDMNAFLSDGEGLGEWLKGLFGYNGNPSLLEVVAYPAFLALALSYFLRAEPVSTATQRSTGTAA